MSLHTCLLRRLQRWPGRLQPGGAGSAERSRCCTTPTSDPLALGASPGWGSRAHPGSAEEGMGGLTALNHGLMGTLRMWGRTRDLWSTLGFGEVMWREPQIHHLPGLNRVPDCMYWPQDPLSLPHPILPYSPGIPGTCWGCGGPSLRRRECWALTSTSVRKWMASGSVTRRFLFSTSFFSLEHLWDTEMLVKGQASVTLSMHSLCVPLRD